MVILFVFVFTQDILEIMKETSNNEGGEFWEKLCSSAEERMLAKSVVEIMKSECRVKDALVVPTHHRFRI